MTLGLITLTTFGGALLGGLLPVGNTDLLVAATALAVGPADAPLIVLAAGVADMLGKSALYQAGAGAIRLPGRTLSTRMDGAMIRIRQMRRVGGLTVFASAATGLPPFYFFSIASGALQIPFPRFIALGLAGRTLRFATLAVLAQLVESNLRGAL